jgi:hypothetical protein
MNISVLDDNAAKIKKKLKALDDNPRVVVLYEREL